jgi:hypothetical protein
MPYYFFRNKPIYENEYSMELKIHKGEINGGSEGNGESVRIIIIIIIIEARGMGNNNNIIIEARGMGEAWG